MVPKILFFLAFTALTPLWLCAQTPQKPEKSTDYVVRPSDCLWNISKRIWKNPNKWPLLYVANEGKIRNPNLIFPGQRFTVPTSAELAQADLKEASRIAYARIASLATKRRQPKAVVGTLEHPGAILSNPSAAPEGTSAQRETVQNPVNPAAPTQENPGSTAPLRGSWDSVKVIVLIAVLFALAGGIWIWRRMGKGPSTDLQKPQPLSSFPQAAEPRIGVQAASPIPPASTPSPPVEPPMKSAVITSISMPSPPPSGPSETKPMAPETTAPTTATQPPNPAETQAFPSQPRDGPGEPPLPPASTNHAA